MQASLRKAFREDGAVLIKGFLTPQQLSQCREAYDWAVDNHGPNAFRMFNDTEQQAHVDNANPVAKDRLEALVASLPLGCLFADLWGSENVWYFAEEVFLKAGGHGSRTLWHQDTSYLPWAGEHWGNAWISFESVPKRNALEIVRGSHRGPRYDGTTFRDPDDPTQPLHGGAPVDAAFPDRHTFVFRFFGDDATFQPLPSDSASGYPPQGSLFANELAGLKAGDPFRHPTFRRLICPDRGELP
ncbi:phytanoyl-CoA dioxygenase family protein [Pseudomonas sp. COR58]|uniref:Phytanoyl-CoA dioxygenase family protein n=1 Tax=Pseudomonas ekonensis TaxID=2842353 RepID=A0ABS6PDH6_9PSED|nr:phytanoyl-CoA dioxygenase family protein [Pseudomonas ekonensis]MBV4458525.1 phytanoyl-CoA dioxygenase family protein [Pseudomonas ekonensis]